MRRVQPGAGQLPRPVPDRPTAAHTADHERRARMGIVADGLNRSVQYAFTRPIPKSAGAQMRYLFKQLKGTRAAADALGISQRTVERYVKDQIRRPRTD